MTLLGVLRDLARSRRRGLRRVPGRDRTRSPRRPPVPSPTTRPRRWHAACAAPRNGASSCRPRPRPARRPPRATAAAMAWKRLFFNQLWPARFKWDAGHGATSRRGLRPLPARGRGRRGRRRRPTSVLPLHRAGSSATGADATEDRGLVGAAYWTPSRARDDVAVRRRGASSTGLGGAHLRRRGLRRRAIGPVHDVRTGSTFASSSRPFPRPAGAGRRRGRGPEVVQRPAGSNTWTRPCSAVLEAERLMPRPRPPGRRTSRRGSRGAGRRDTTPRTRIACRRRTRARAGRATHPGPRGPRRR